MLRESEDANRGRSWGWEENSIAHVTGRINPAWLSPERFAEYEEAAAGDCDLVPKILRHVDAVDWNKANAARLAKSSDPLDVTLSKVINASRAHGWTSSVYQVFILSGPKDSETVTLPSPIGHRRRGRGSAFAQGHRYLRLAQLHSAKDTEDLALS